MRGREGNKERDGVRGEGEGWCEEGGGGREGEGEGEGEREKDGVRREGEGERERERGGGREGEGWCEERGGGREGSNVYKHVKSQKSTHNCQSMCLNCTSDDTYTQPIAMQEKCRLTIAKATNAIHGRHLDDKCKHVINERVQSLVCEHSPWEMGHRLQLVVDEQLWCHGDEPWVCVGGRAFVMEDS